ncbi:MAG: hypothetical protein AB7O64_16200 [Methylibium sp.]
MFIDLHARSTSQALTGRASSPVVRNPLLSLPSAARAADMPVAAREWLLLFLQDVRRDAQERAAKSLRTHRGLLDFSAKSDGPDRQQRRGSGFISC